MNLSKTELAFLLWFISEFSVVWKANCYYETSCQLRRNIYSAGGEPMLHTVHPDEQSIEPTRRFRLIISSIHKYYSTSND
ncbi:uncharacterized protein BO96DRAFT_439854 [Aspergillus niger CBS 101883]|uniref:Secreted protein n=2 Tax=Aspergillus niger TaxID=5061 RepID=A2R3M4_ASPNC|nr:uncharacterized protein BO96DRAFT_439854 [Aspergillus niger CBS 101883]XP_059602324.1 hypothetical protein An14g04810 [Aspergillus niger]PYH50501.1 hypothetical protein BO96DRAFT_439854 [Aspergillus niger CBS 101883]CAK42042.1 hypothetical protein An14g04810 [Aspergillus niger]